ncbi:hypothetical protein [Roseibium sp.]|uniref:hypothetical protein n=1 Tax=Roseibium sp. TaxID=1936156 RepID=UPI0032633A6D
MTKKTMDIEALLKWAYCEELPRADANMGGGGGMASGWSSVESYAQLLTVIDDNRYGVLPALSIDPGEPHADAVAVHIAVLELDKLDLDLPDDWSPMPELNALGAHGLMAIRSALDGLTIVDGDGHRRLRRKPSDLVRRLAIIGVVPDGMGEPPALKMLTNAAGQPRWFRRHVEQDVDCFGAPVERSFEVEDGWDFSRKRAKRGAYPKQYLDPDPVSVLSERGEYDILRACLMALCDELNGKMVDHTVSPCSWDVSPWEQENARATRSERRVLRAG